MARILIVEDESIIAMMLEQHLEGLGHAVVVKDDAVAGYESFAGQDFDLVLTDFNMPVANGDYLITHIRNHPERSDTPIILMSARMDPHVPVPLVNGRLRKPFTNEEMIEAIGTLLISPRITASGSAASEAQT